MSPKQAVPLNLEYALLGLLAQQPRHGYELHKELTNLEGLGLIWRVKQANLYALLDKLEGHGLVTARQIPSENHPPRKEYHLTQPGQEAFEAWMLAPVEHGREIRQDFLAKFYFARLYGEATARRVVEAQRDRLLEVLAGLEKKETELVSNHPFEKQVYQFRMKQIQAMLDWLDACLID